MNLRSADPARTYAVLVAVEKYEAGWPLSGPVTDLVQFHEWLRSRGVPPDQITVLATPADKNAPLLAHSGLKYSPATSGEVRGAFNDLHARSGDLLVVFWAGHGLIQTNTRRLFLADATENDKRNLDLDALRESLGSTYFKGFPRQIVIVDACANYARLPFSIPGEELPRGDPLPHEQFVFFAARSGEVAKNLGEENRGLFSREYASASRLRLASGHARAG